MSLGSERDLSLGSERDLPLDGAELILIRHGQTTANARGIGQGRADWPLSDLGHRQAAATAKRIATLTPIAAVYTSPLSRAADTAAPIAAALGLAPIPVPELVEIDVGVLSGRTWAELEELHPREMAAFALAERETPHPRNRELIPGWEPIPAIVARTWGAIRAIAARHPGERTVVVAHGGVLNAFLTHLLEGDAREVPWVHHVANCAITHLALEPAGPRAIALRDIDHVRALRDRAGGGLG